MPILYSVSIKLNLKYLSQATVLTATLIPLPFGTLGDIYTPINIQIAVRLTAFSLSLEDRSLLENESGITGNISDYRHCHRCSRANDGRDDLRWFGAGCSWRNEKSHQPHSVQKSSDHQRD